MIFNDSKLSSCPFCGDEPEQREAWVSCPNCLAEGPGGLDVSRRRARIDWNERSLSAAAETILNAGCSGVAQLTWNMRLYLNGAEPKYPAGDAWHDDAELYEALESALKRYAKNDGAP